MYRKPNSNIAYYVLIKMCISILKALRTILSTVFLKKTDTVPYIDLHLAEHLVLSFLLSRGGFVEKSNQ